MKMQCKVWGEDIFAENYWYFRNALVRANYTNLQNNVHETTKYLELFLRNLLLGQNNPLHNRSMHISGIFDRKVDIQKKKIDIVGKKVDIEDKKIDIQGEKVDIEDKKVDIQKEKMNIECIFTDKIEKFTSKTLNNIQILFDNFGYDEIFGRVDVVKLVVLKESSASKLISNLVKVGIIVPVAGYGKGRYRFFKANINKE